MRRGIAALSCFLLGLALSVPTAQAAGVGKIRAVALQLLDDLGVTSGGTYTAPVQSVALLDGSEHTDTVAQAVTRGSVIYGNSTPAWDELALGADNAVLASDGTDLAYETLTSLMDSAFGSTQGQVLYRNATVWTVLATGTSGQVLHSGGAGANVSWNTDDDTAQSVALLDGSEHTDTAAQAVTRGSIIRGSSAPAWDELVLGADNSVLASDGTDIAYETLTSLMDSAFGSTQGQVLYRNATVWTVLATGTSGQVLESGGAGANVAWGTDDGNTIDTLAATLGAGLITGGNDISLSSGDDLISVAELDITAAAGANAVTATGGAGSTSNGGAITLAGGAGDGANTGGAASLTSGAGGPTGASGALTLASGSGGGTSGNSGAVAIGSGDTTDGVSGNTIITTGDALGGTNDSGDTLIDVGTSGGGTTGTVDIAPTNASATNIGPAAGGHTVTFNGTTDATILDGTCTGLAFNAPTIDASSAGALTVGATTATSVNISATTEVTTISGLLTVNEDANFVGDLEIGTGAELVFQDTPDVFVSRGAAGELEIGATTGANDGVLDLAGGGTASAVLLPRGGLATPALFFDSGTGVFSTADNTLDFAAGSANPVYVISTALGLNAGVFQALSTNGYIRWGAGGDVLTYGDNATLTDNTATTVLSLVSADGDMGGVVITYFVRATDATEYQSESGTVTVSLVDDAGGVVAAIAETSQQSVSSGTLTTDWTVVTTPDDQSIEIQLDADSSLTTSEFNVDWKATTNADFTITVP